MLEVETGRYNELIVQFGQTIDFLTGPYATEFLAQLHNPRIMNMTYDPRNYFDMELADIEMLVAIPTHSFRLSLIHEFQNLSDLKIKLRIPAEINPASGLRIRTFYNNYGELVTILDDVVQGFNQDASILRFEGDFMYVEGLHRDLLVPLLQWHSFAQEQLASFESSQYY
jgi:hypothetical protein